MSSLQNTPGVTPYPQEFADSYVGAGIWGDRRIEELITDAAAERLDALAVADDVEALTYRQLLTRVEQARNLLAGAGIGAEQNVVLQMPNSVDTIAVLLATFRLGARPVLALATHRATEIAASACAATATHWILGDLTGVQLDPLVAEVTRRVRQQGVEPPVVLRVPALRTTAPRRSSRTLNGRWAGRSTAADLVDQATTGEARRRGADASELAFFQLSGGTTGPSKLVPRAHREYAYSFLRSNELCGVGPETVLVVPIPVTHNFPLSSPGVFGVLAAGGAVVLTGHGDPDSVCAAVQRHRATHLIAVPPLIQALLDSTARQGADLSGLCRVIVGGARLAPEVARRVRTEIAALQQVYGMAEGLVCYTAMDDDPETILNTQGRPMSPYDEVRVVDPERAPAVVAVAPGEVGELQTRGPYTIRGYYRAGPAERAAFTADGFYRTGDLVRIDPTGSIAVVGRSKEQINRGGEKIAPAEVENALLEHPRVHDVCVLGEADEVLGERVVAYVVPKPVRRAEEPALDRRSLRRHLVQCSIAPFKIPDEFRVVDTLPTTAVGKIARRRVAPEPMAPIAVGIEPEPGEIDLVGVGFGPANMALAIALRELGSAADGSPSTVFFDSAPGPTWHEGLLFKDSSMQVNFAKDLVTLRNPRSEFTFLQFLHDRGRLLDFLNRSSMSPLRIEFVEYLRWAAGKLCDDVRYASRVRAVSPVVHDGAITGYRVDVDGPGGRRRLRARNVAVAAGLQPRLPEGIPAGPRVWHSHDHLRRVGAVAAGETGAPAGIREIVVIGGGQSAAEVMLDLHQRFPASRIHNVHRRFGLAPSDSSPFVNQIFDPDTVDLLYAADEAERARTEAAHANTNDAVVAPSTLQQLYDLDYRDRWLGEGRFVWHRNSELAAVEQLGPVAGERVRLGIRSRLSGQVTTIDTDLLVCATGYTALDPATLLGEGAGLLRRDPAGRVLAERDYAARWRLPAGGALYLLGQTRHQHGISNTLLSTIAVRAGEIALAVDASRRGRRGEQDGGPVATAELPAAGAGDAGLTVVGV